jgi:hypothetical protein
MPALGAKPRKRQHGYCRSSQRVHATPTPVAARPPPRHNLPRSGRRLLRVLAAVKSVLVVVAQASVVAVAPLQPPPPDGDCHRCFFCLHDHRRHNRHHHRRRRHHPHADRLGCWFFSVARWLLPSAPQQRPPRPCRCRRPLRRRCVPVARLGLLRLCCARRGEQRQQDAVPRVMVSSKQRRISDLSFSLSRSLALPPRLSFCIVSSNLQGWFAARGTQARTRLRGTGPADDGKQKHVRVGAPVLQQHTNNGEQAA